VGTPTLHWDGRAGHGRHGGEASALRVGSDDVGLDSFALSYQEERADKKDNIQTAARFLSLAAVFLSSSI